MNFSLKNSIRREIKFKVFFKDLGKLYSWIHNSSFKKKYENRQVNSLYYDTSNLDFAYDNVIGQSKRLKIRARWYSKNNDKVLNNFDKKNQFKFEIKRKIKNLSDKIILSELFCEKNSSVNDRKKLLKKSLNTELSKNSELSKLTIKDVIFISYYREYYQNFFFSDIRLTVDNNLNCTISNNSNFHKVNNMSTNFVIVELKFKPNDEDLVKDIMRNFEFRNIRSSKYILALSKYYRFSY